MLIVNIRVTYEDEEGYTKISPMMTFRIAINRIVYLKIERE